MSDELPKYRVLNEQGFYADDNLFAEGTEVFYEGIPNQQLEPLNEAAEKKMGEFLVALRAGSKQLSAAAGIPIKDQAILNEDNAMRLARIVSPQAASRVNVPIMSAPLKRQTVSVVGAKEVPEQLVGKRGPGRPRSVTAAGEVGSGVSIGA
jgi:hypothetical protein